MQVENLCSLPQIVRLRQILSVAGRAGLTIAREFLGTSTRVLILESGELKAHPHFAELNRMDSVGDPPIFGSDSKADRARWGESPHQVSPKYSTGKTPTTPAFAFKPSLLASGFIFGMHVYEEFGPQGGCF
jgi:hypothetical protein